MIENKKICSKCKEEKDISKFAKKYKTKDGTQKYSSICKTCVNEKDAERRNTKEYKKYKLEYDRSYHKKNKEKILERKKEYHVENRYDILKKKKEYRKTDKYKISNKEYRENNREKYREIQKRYRDRHPHIIAWRNILYRTLYYLGTEKEGDTKGILGYSAAKLKHHIEKQFVEGMTWENYGEWEIDHIKPLTKFDIGSLPSEVNSLSNLQPLWKKENREKYNNYNI